MLSILCVRLTIKVKVGMPESFNVGWYPSQNTGWSHLFLLAKLLKSFNKDLLELIRNRRGWYINSDYSVTDPINFCTADHFHSF